MPPSPPQSDGFNGPGQFNAVWQDVKVAPAPCPAADPTAACYTVTGTASLSLLGPVALTRKDVVGIGSASPPAGCVNASTMGTVANATGVLSFVATGELCGRRTSFTILSSSATGSMAPYLLRAVMINDATISDAVTETWSGEISPN